jgi:hypothetical protein
VSSDPGGVSGDMLAAARHVHEQIDVHVQTLDAVHGFGLTLAEQAGSIGTQTIVAHGQAIAGSAAEAMRALRLAQTLIADLARQLGAQS